LAATATKVALYVMLRFMLGIFGVDFSLHEMPFEWILLVLGVLGILSGSLVAIYQDNVKRMLAYSSVAQIGYMVLGIAIATTAGITAAVLHMLNHALMKGVLFLALGAVVYRLGSVRLRDLSGLGRHMPWTMAAVVVGGLSLIGVPPTVGFISKWYLVIAVLEHGWWPLALVVLIGSVLALIYVWRVLEVAYLRPRPADAPPVSEAPLSMLIPIWLLVIANIYFGIATQLSVGSAERAAALLMGAAPMGVAQ
jgi:multicomponent Na+:H+ antiporter subunit D